jgi:mannose-6-phosphate isomerase-like protein (cupin superfamily)
MPMTIVSSDKVYTVQPPATIDFKVNNPLARLMSLLQQIDFGAERESYLANLAQYLIPYDYLELYGPSGPQWAETDPRKQDNKEDFQKQNVRDFRCTDTWVARGWATTHADSNPDDTYTWTGPFLFLSYRGGPDSKLSQTAGHKLGDRIRLHLHLRGTGSTPVVLDVPYNPLSDRYEIEIWGYPGSDLRSKLGPKGVAAMDRGNLITNPVLIQGAYNDFAREGLDDRDMRTVSPTNAMHPVLPLTLEVTWADQTETYRDQGDNGLYIYQFNMILRGWDNFLKVGVSEAPHGGFGFLHYRNVLSNYFDFRNSEELGRDVEPWMFAADDRKPSIETHERFFAVEYMDIHVLKGECGIGLHRHRDNQEIFYLLNGTAIMVMGDWCKLPERDRCFEIRTMGPGSFTLLKPGNLHALYNVTDLDISLLMFGGYD